MGHHLVRECVFFVSWIFSCRAKVVSGVTHRCRCCVQLKKTCSSGPLWWRERQEVCDSHSEVFKKKRYPNSWMVYFIENHFQMDDDLTRGTPMTQETSIHLDTCRVFSSTVMAPKYQLMSLKQCHKPPMTGNGKHSTYENGDLGDSLCLFF